MKAEIKAKRIFGNAKDDKQCLSGLQLPVSRGSDPSKEKLIRPDTTVKDINVKQYSIALNNVDSGISMASQGPLAFPTMSLVSRLYRGEGVIAAPAYRQATQTGVS